MKREMYVPPIKNETSEYSPLFKLCFYYDDSQEINQPINPHTLLWETIVQSTCHIM